jgi:hypothetical protein
MPFDSTKPANGSPIVASELRNQFNALKALMDDLQAQVTALQTAPRNIVLSYDRGLDNATWTYDGAAPPQWELSYSPDGGVTWPMVVRIGGGSNSMPPDLEPSLMRVRAVDAANAPISEFSNQVNVG